MLSLPLVSQAQFEAYSEPIPGSDQSIEMTPIEGGTFYMGSTKEEDESPRHEVKVGSFWMGTYEITWQQYTLFVKEKLSDLKANAAADGPVNVDAVSLPTPPYIDMSFGMGRQGYPAINMTQYAAVQFAKWLTAQTGHFYRLPTEAEWEYACRAGSETAYSFGDDASKLGQYAWYKKNSEEAYHKIGTKKPNAWGLYDMHGNVAEWTMDQYVADAYQKYANETADNPWVYPEELYPRVVRGGSWSATADMLRCANRRGSQAAWKVLDPQIPKSLWWLTNAAFVGFRLVRPLDPPPPEEIEKYWLEPIKDYGG